MPLNTWNHIQWSAKGASNEHLRKKHPKKEASLEGLVVLATLDSSHPCTHINDSFIITHGHIQHHNTLISEVKSLPKTVAKHNSRGLGIEFGWSVLPGYGRGKADVEYRNGICQPYQRSGNNHKKTQVLQESHVKPLMSWMWEELQKAFPKEAEFFLGRTPERYRYVPGTAFSKVTVALNNPAGFHYDKHNLHGSMTAIYITTDPECEGGEQVLEENGEAIVIQAHSGCLIIGDYTHFRHCVLPTLKGNRVAIIAYSMEQIYQYTKDE